MAHFCELHLIPSWDLAVVLQALQQDPFEPLQSVDLNALSMKMALLTALTLVKRVGNLQALSINGSCLEFGLADSHVVLRPQPGVLTRKQKGEAVSKQRISHWLVDVIRLAYQNRGLPCPLGVKAHSTRGVAALAALANGASLTDICRAAC
ncbi:Protease HtpX [Labeo rohita]|uniref:Protease HtpX n=1 Tax=Labeo rohita TaxID=84645 RepID=A0ABQ8L963_LABRO|nr:Protease HtpX [Labeo rohita]